jgi:5-methylcytosine-specific restriction endonuclease McrA
MADEIISRKEARAQGLKFYFTGKPCVNGHIVKRNVCSESCTQCQREKSRQWMRQRRLKNPERAREIDRIWAANNPDKLLAKERKRRLNHPDKTKLRGIQASAIRRSRKRMATGSFTVKDINEILKAQKGRCAYCRKKLSRSYHVDHIVPLARGGTNERRNIQVTCKKCNLAKNSKDPMRFAQELGRLL